MEVLIKIMNKLQDIFNSVGADCVHLPQIVVIGTQSSGKSSVLESLVGRDFLPKGPGIVTRCPLILQLAHTLKEAALPCNKEYPENLDEFGKFLHTGNKIYVDFDKIRKEIKDETSRKSGTNKGISSDAINLKIYSQRVISLTLVDLPGMTKVPVGDQPDDIEIQIKQLILKHIRNPNALILAVTPANTDFVTSESLKLAKECDPDGRRTLAVITKLDLMDAGTDAFDALCGRVIPVKLGIIGVVNRSQQDIVGNNSIEDAIKDEALFLQKHYPTLASRNGTPFLAKTLNRLLMQHIKNCLPSLKTRINRMMDQYQSLLLSYGRIVTNHNHKLLQIITKFTAAYCSTIEGTAKSIKTSELCGGARICYIFHETFARALNDIDDLPDPSTLDVMTAVKNASGKKPALFIPQVAFELLVKRQIKRLEKPSLRCIELVYEEMQNMIHHCRIELQQETDRFPKLEEKITDIVKQLLQRRLPTTNQMVENLIEIELSYINTKHPDFYVVSPNVDFLTNRSEKIASDVIIKLENEIVESNQNADLILKTKKNPKFREFNSGPNSDFKNVSNKELIDNMDPNEEWIDSFKNSNQFKRSFDSARVGVNKLEDFDASTNQENLSCKVSCTLSKNLTYCERKVCETIKHLIKSYFAIVRKTIQDTVPKAINHFLVDFVQDNLQSELITHLYNKENLPSLMQEAEPIATGRKEAKEMLQALQKASQIISEMEDALL